MKRGICAYQICLVLVVLSTKIPFYSDVTVYLAKLDIGCNILMDKGFILYILIP